MRQQPIHRVRVATLVAVLASLSVPAFGQTGHLLSAAVQAQAAQAAPAMETVKRLSIDEAFDCFHRRCGLRGLRLYGGGQ